MSKNCFILKHSKLKTNSTSIGKVSCSMPFHLGNNGLFQTYIDTNYKRINDKIIIIQLELIWHINDLHYNGNN